MERSRAEKAEAERALTQLKASTELDPQRSDLSGHPQFQRVSFCCCVVCVSVFFCCLVANTLCHQFIPSPIMFYLVMTDSFLGWPIGWKRNNQSFYR